MGLTIVGVWSALQLTHAGTLASISPSGASVGVTFSIVGTGFNATAANNLVTFTSFDSTSVSASATTVGAADPTTGARRITVPVPQGVKIGTASVRVVNTGTGETSDTRTFEVIGINLPNTTSASPGSTGVQVRVVGSPNTNFVAGTRVSFGAGITVTNTAVESPNSVVATISVPSTIALGTRDVGVTTSTQTALLSKGFTIGTAPANQPPNVDAGQDQTITLPDDASLQGNVTDDGLPVGSVLTREWTKQSGPGTVTFVNASAEVTSASFSSAGTYLLRLTATDTALTAFGQVTITVQAAAPINRAPVATDDTAATNFETPLSVVAPGVLGNDSDPDAGDTITALLAAGPGHAASFALNPNGSFAYTPTAGFSGPDSFTYRAVDQKNAQSNIATVSITVAARPNQAPHFTSSPILTGSEGQPYAYQAAALDPDADPLTFSLPQAPGGMTISAAGLITWTPTGAQAGPQNVTVHVQDGRGGSDNQSFVVTVAAAITLQSLELTPESARFATTGTTRTLNLTGRRSDQSTIDLTLAATGTTYESSNPFVATVSAAGVVTSVADGEATITARNSGLSATAAMIVEVGVTLDSLDLTPASPTLRTPGATQALTLRGHFSDQTTRDLTSAAGVTFRSSDDRVATVSTNGRVTALTNGAATVTAALDTLTATANVTVAISGGTGFLTGRVFDDTRGQPLAGAMIALLADGTGALDAPPVVIADEQGRFVIAGRAGAALVQVTKDGFTAVERRGDIPVNTSARLLDARLTPFDVRTSAVVSAFGGEVHDADNQASLQLPPGTLPADASMRITRISAQGLVSRLPLGWSPVAAADITPGALTFAQGATLRLPNAASLGANVPVVVAAYDAAQHAWVRKPSGQVTADGRFIQLSLDRAGQVVCLVADAAPFTPPAVAVGEALDGVDAPGFPADAAASGDVVPRSAPPGDNVRAVGRLALQTPGLPSGTALRVHVSEQFDLLDTSRVVPLPFTEDILVHARPRPPTDGPLGATFPITPSRSYSIQELMLGVVKLDVDAASDAPSGVVIGNGGGTVNDALGDALNIPPDALPTDSLVGLRRITANELTVGVPPGVDLLAALAIDLVGAHFTQPASLTISRPGGLADDTQVLIAQTFSDPLGVRRLRVVGVGQLDGTHIVSQKTINGASLPGVGGGGEYLFLRPQPPMGFVAGRVFGAGGTTPRALALVTADGSPFADLTTATGAFLVAATPAAAVRVQATDTSSRDAAAGAVGVPGRDVVATLDLTLSLVVPTITSVTPANNDKNVALDVSVAINFSEAIDAASITEASVQLQLGGAPIAVARTLSADRRRLVLRPQSPLAGKSTFSVVVTSAIRDLSGNPLAAFIPVSFSTLDPTKPPQPPPGQITAELPDEGGQVLIFGTGGSAEPLSPVTATNLRTQETATVLALGDGSFRVRLVAVVGDELALTFRDVTGREITLTVTQFESPDGSTAIGSHGGTIPGPDGRRGLVLPRSLTNAGIFRMTVGDNDTALPTLPTGLAYADRFTVGIGAAAFSRLSSLTLTESQGRFAAQVATITPFASTGELTVPADFLTNASLQFTATAQDAAGNRESAVALTLVVAASPDVSTAEANQATEFPTVFLDAPGQAVANQQVVASAIAPAARVDLELPLPAAAATGQTFLLARAITVGLETRLSIVDRLEPTGQGADRRLRTVGRDMPGATSDGDYVVIASEQPLVFLTGRASGPASTVLIDGLPFAFETAGPNGTFQLPALAGQSFTLRFFALTGGASLGTTTGVAPAAGTANLGAPLAPAAGTLTVSVDPAADAIVDIGQPIVFHFSERIDPASVGASGIIVTDAGGSRTFGAIGVSSDATTLTFTPQRRLRYSTTYRWGVATTVLAVSGARLATPATGQFTTFAPGILSTTPTGHGAPIAASAALAVLGTPTGFTVLDIASPLVPVVLAEPTVDGGSGGVALFTGSITDRNGQTRSGPFAIVAAGNDTTASRLLTFDLSTPTSPVLIGSTQLTAAPGVTPPPGVPDVIGVPAGVTVTPDRRAVVALGAAGVLTVAIADAIPLDSVNLARGVGSRFPGSGVSAAAMFTDRVAVASGSALDILDGATLTRLGGIATTAHDVATLAAFVNDVNGDGARAADETFDLTVVAGGTDGTLQWYRTGTSGDPSLLSVVRFTSETTSVVLDAAERLGYVGLGAHGLAIVDLDGPASVQPIDGDHDGTDDRILAILPLSGSAQHVALALKRGIGFVSQLNGLSVVQLLPPRVRFLTLVRDPIPAQSGDEEDTLQQPLVFTTDSAARVVVDALVPTGGLVLTIDEVPRAGGPRVLSFGGNTSAKPLAFGLNDVQVEIAGGSAGADATFRVTDLGGHRLAGLSFDLARADFGALNLDELFVVPETATVPADAAGVQLTVGGVFSGGRVHNLTRGETGTTYESRDTTVAAVRDDGFVDALAGGEAEVRVAHRGVFASALLTVGRPPVLVAIDSPSFVLTLRDGVPTPLPLGGRYSDGSVLPVTEIAGASFSSDDEAVLAVDGSGRLQALTNGVATVHVQVGTLSAALTVAVELRQPAAISDITLDAPVTSAAQDHLPLFVVTRVSGTGSLDGLPIQLAVAGPSPQTLTAISSREGASAFAVEPALPGGYTLTASVIDPASGQTRTATASIAISPASGDVEPNASDASAAALDVGAHAPGSVGSDGDLSDVYRLTNGTDGQLTISFSLPDGVVPASVQIVIRSATGDELARTTATSLDTVLTLNVPNGAVFVSIESLSGSTTYDLSAEFEQAPIAVTAVTPTSGGPGTLVTVTGAGFSANLADSFVTFGGVTGRVVSSSPTQLVAQVPMNAVNGPLVIVVNTRDVTAVDNFQTGTSGPLPAPTIRKHAERFHFDPGTNWLVDVGALIVRFDPLTGASTAQAVAQLVGAEITAFVPNDNTYVLALPSNQTIDGLEAVRRQLQQQPTVAAVTLNTALGLDGPPIDARDRAGKWPVSKESRARYLSMIHFFEAADAIRATPPFDKQSGFKPVKIAVIDSNFDPSDHNEFVALGGSSFLVTFRAIAGNGWSDVTSADVSAGGNHGTAVSSLIAAVNNGPDSRVSGIINGALAPDEPRFELIFYACGTVTEECVRFAASDARARGIDIINISSGESFAASPTEFTRQYEEWRRVLGPASQMLVVVSAGNNGTYGDAQLPAALGRSPSAPALGQGTDGQNLRPLPNVITVGAVAVGKRDNTGDEEDERAVFQKTLVKLPFLLSPDKPPAGLITTERLCNRATEMREKASNCGPNVTIAAPGERLFVTTTSGPSLSEQSCCTVALAEKAFGGTSGAAPIVAATAALLQTIRPDTARIAPAELRRILVDTGDDISDSWRPFTGPIKRLNVLAAVYAVLPAISRQKIWITDEGPGFGTDGDVGRLIGLEIDPLTGERMPASTDVVLPLKVTRRGVTATAREPLTVTVSPAGDRVYVVTSTNPLAGTNLGAGLMVLNTRSELVETFIPFSGAAFPPDPAESFTPVEVSTLRPGLALSNDGRIAYASVGRHLIIIDTTKGRVVKRLGDLPLSYRHNADDFAASELSTRLQAIDGFIAGAGGAAQELTDLEVSPDGTVLYAIVQTGGGPGVQPGIVIPIDIDLYRDAVPSTTALESNLTRYMKLVADGVTLASNRTGTFAGDEPQAVTVSADGGRLYLLNGGFREALTIPPVSIDFVKYEPLLGPTVAGTGPSLGLLDQRVTEFKIDSPILYDELLRDYKEQALSGVTLLDAAGVFDVFAATGDPPTTTPVWQFPSEVVFGWDVPASAARLVNQFRSPLVYAKRPFGVAMRPDGKRAIVAFSATGNFGVLDLDAQTHFTVAGASAQPATEFTGLVGVTPAIILDSHLWPQRGAYSSAGGHQVEPVGADFDSNLFVRSFDESLLFPGPIAYAQNGRFAAAVHKGASRPMKFDAALPDFQTDNWSRLALNAIGFNVPPFSDTGTGPNDEIVSSFQPYRFDRGGGALTILSDDAISSDLTTNATGLFFAQNPICRTHISPIDGCATPVSSQVFGYIGSSAVTPTPGSLPAGATTPGFTRFSRPRGVAIQPFVAIASPQFGDHVRPSSAFSVVWRDGRIAGATFTIFDLGPENSPLATPVRVVSPLNISFSPRELTRHAATRTLKQILRNHAVTSGHRYRVDVDFTLPIGETLSSMSVTVRADR